jgi:hypothetical protein
MPYLTPTDKSRQELAWRASTAGELNYRITRQITRYIEGKGLSYQTINDILGALDGAGKEFYRRVVAPYEDLKIKENGDVYDEQTAPLKDASSWTNEPFFPASGKNLQRNSLD